MRVFVTGASGFVGRWLVAELEAGGHHPIPAPGPEILDITDEPSLESWLSRGGLPDAVVHLAGIAFGPDATNDPASALRVNVGGTLAVFEVLRRLGVRPPVLVAGSSEVYGDPNPSELPLTEYSPIAARRPYGISKMAQEAVALEASVRYGFPVVITRSFNHTGPGQRPVFVVPAMARRVLAVKRGEARAIPAGNVSVERDLSDVRDVVRAYRLLIEAAATGGLHAQCTVVNVASGATVSIRWVVEELCEFAGVTAPIETDPFLVRQGEAQEIRGDRSLLTQLTQWQPRIPIQQTLADVFADAESAVASEG